MPEKPEDTPSVNRQQHSNVKKFLAGALGVGESRIMDDAFSIEEISGNGSVRVRIFTSQIRRLDYKFNEEIIMQKLRAVKGVSSVARIPDQSEGILRRVTDDIACTIPKNKITPRGHLNLVTEEVAEKLRRAGETTEE